MKKVINKSFLFSLLLIVCLSCCLALVPLTAASAESYIDNEGNPIRLYSSDVNLNTEGTTKDSVTVYADASVPFSGYEVTLVFPQFMSITNVNGLQNDRVNAVFVPGFNECTVSAAYSSAYDMTENGIPLFQVEYETNFKDSYYYGEYNVALQNCRFVDENRNVIKYVDVEIKFVVKGGETAVKGDWDGDGKVTLQDVMYIQQFLVNRNLGLTAEMSTAQYNAADIDGNGVIDIVDCQYIQSYLIGKIDSLDINGGGDDPISDVRVFYNGNDILDLTDATTYYLTLNGVNYAEKYTQAKENDQYYLVTGGYGYRLAQVNCKDETFEIIDTVDFNDVEIELDESFVGEYTLDVDDVQESGAACYFTVSSHGAFRMELDFGKDGSFVAVGRIDFTSDGIAYISVFGWGKEDALMFMPVSYDLQTRVLTDKIWYTTYHSESGEALTLFSDENGVEKYTINLNDGEYVHTGYFFIEENMAYLVFDSMSAEGENVFRCVELNFETRSFEIVSTIDFSVIGEPVYAEYAGAYRMPEDNAVIYVRANGTFARYEWASEEEGGYCKAVYNGTYTLDVEAGIVTVYLFGNEDMTMTFAIDFASHIISSIKEPEYTYQISAYSYARLEVPKGTKYPTFVNDYFNKGEFYFVIATMDGETCVDSNVMTISLAKAYIPAGSVDLNTPGEFDLPVQYDYEGQSYKFSVRVIVKEKVVDPVYTYITTAAYTRELVFKQGVTYDEFMNEYNVGSIAVTTVTYADGVYESENTVYYEARKSRLNVTNVDIFNTPGTYNLKGYYFTASGSSIEFDVTIVILDDGSTEIVFYADIYVGEKFIERASFKPEDTMTYFDAGQYAVAELVANNPDTYDGLEYRVVVAEDKTLNDMFASGDVITVFFTASKNQYIVQYYVNEAYVTARAFEFGTDLTFERAIQTAASAYVLLNPKLEGCEWSVSFLPDDRTLEDYVANEDVMGINFTVKQDDVYTYDYSAYYNGTVSVPQGTDYTTFRNEYFVGTLNVIKNYYLNGEPTGKETIEVGDLGRASISAADVKLDEVGEFDIVGYYDVASEGVVVSFTVRISVYAAEKTVIFYGYAPEAYGDKYPVKLYEDGSYEVLYVDEEYSEVIDRGEYTVEDGVYFIENWGYMTVTEETTGDGGVRNVLLPMQHEEDPTASYTFAYPGQLWTLDLYEDKLVQFYIGEELCSTEPYYFNEDGKLVFGAYEFTVREDNTLYIAEPESGFMFQAPTYWSGKQTDVTDLKFYDNGKVYRYYHGIYEGEDIMNVCDWNYVEGDATAIYVPAFNATYYLWDIDGQWHGTYNYTTAAEIEKWNMTPYAVNGVADDVMDVYVNGEVIIVIFDDYACYGSIEGGLLNKYDYTSVECFIIDGESVYASEKYIVNHKYQIEREDHSEIFLYTGDVFLSGEKEQAGKAVFRGMNSLNVVFDLVYDYSVDANGYYVLSHEGTEVVYLFWNADQGVFYVYSYDNLYYPLNVVYTVDGNQTQAEFHAYAFASLNGSLIGQPVVIDGVNYVITGVYFDEDMAQPVGDDYVFTSLAEEPADYETYYVTVAVYTPQQIVESAYRLAPGKSFDYEVVLTGTVTAVNTVYSEQYHNVTVTIEVEGMGRMPVKVFRLVSTYSYSCECDVYSIKVGDTVTVKGIMNNYNGSVQMINGSALELISKE